MKIGSLCSGIGGLEVGLERAGLGHTVWQCEKDQHAREVLARHWSVPIYDDVKAQDWDDVEPVDVICAGYPCQPFSSAGRRGGSDDPRHLWPAVRDAVGRLGPRLVVLENVRRHLSLGFDQVLGDLADLGFDAEWCLLRASDLGAPHQRARLFVAAHADDSGRRGWPSRDEPEVGGRDGVPTQWLEGQHQPAGGHGPAADPSHVGCQRDGSPRGRRAGPADSGGPAAADADEHGPRRPAQEQGRPVVGGGAEDDDLATDWGPYGPAIARWEQLTRPVPAPTIDGRLSPAFVEWMMGFPEGWVDGLTRTAALRCLGNAVVPQVAELFGRQLMTHLESAAA